MFIPCNKSWNINPQEVLTTLCQYESHVQNTLVKVHWQIIELTFRYIFFIVTRAMTRSRLIVRNRRVPVAVTTDSKYLKEHLVVYSIMWQSYPFFRSARIRRAVMRAADGAICFLEASRRAHHRLFHLLWRHRAGTLPYEGQGGGVSVK